MAEKKEVEDLESGTEIKQRYRNFMHAETKLLCIAYHSQYISKRA